MLTGAVCSDLCLGAEVGRSDVGDLASLVRPVRGLAVADPPGHACPCSLGHVWWCPSALDSESASSSIRFSKACLKNVFSVLLIFIYLLLMAVAVFLVYQTIMDFREKLKHPVMSVSYKEVDRYDAPGRACPDRHPGPGLGHLCKYCLKRACTPSPVPGTAGRGRRVSMVWVWRAHQRAAMGTQ